MQKPSRPSDFWLIILLGSLSTISPFSIDMYLPAFPAMAEALRTTVAQVSLSVSSYFVGFALGQILYGPLLDRFGRKRPVYFGLTLYALTAFACLHVQSVEQLLVLRFIQSLGGCVAMVASTAMVRDFFGVEKAGRVFSLLMLIIGVSPLLAPTLGGYLTSTYGWKSVFWFLLVGDILILIATTLFLPESHPADPQVSLKPRPILKSFYGVLMEKQFATFAVSGALSFAGLFVYVAGSPIIFMETHHLSAKMYGVVFAVLSVGFIGGSQVNLLMLRKFKEANIVRYALGTQSVAAIILAVLAAAGLANLAVTLGLLFIILSCLGLINPNASALALGPFTQNVGTASSLLGFIQIGMGALFSLGVGAFNMSTPAPIFGILAVCTSLAFLVLLFGYKKMGDFKEADPNLVSNMH